MMKKFNVKAKKGFMDRYTGKKIKAGEEFEVSGERLREIRRSGDYVEVLGEVKETAPAKAPEAKTKK